MRPRTSGFAAVALLSFASTVPPAGAATFGALRQAAEASEAEPSAGAPVQAEAGPKDSRPPRPRSVLFYLIDTCRRDRMAFEGYERKTTPFLAWLAERSVVFEACYSQAPWTKPSMASMLTSRYPSSTGVYRMEHLLPAEHLTWPEVLKAKGLYTAGFSANIVMGGALSNFAQGFDHFVESTAINRGDPIRFASGSARKLNEHAFAWLDRADHWPMLLYMHSVDPHEEYEPEPGYLEQFADPERHPRFREEWKKLLASRPLIPGLYVTQDNFDRTGIDSASFIAHASNLYDANILANDDQLQRLWNKLQEDGWGEDFVLVLTSDHGEEFFEHGGTSHGYSLYDEMLRVPLMIYAPGLLPAGKRITTPVRSLDIYPTLCELLGLDVPAGIQGESLVPLVRAAVPNQASPEGRAIFSEHREDPLQRRLGQGSGVMFSLRRGPWKFILNQESPQMLARPRFELYDLETDPLERHNVAEAQPELVKRLEREIQQFIADHRQLTPLEGEASQDPEVLEQLRALGYIGGEEDEPELAAPDLWEALDSGDPGRVRQSLEAGANADQLDEVLGVSPLSMAAMKGDLELARLLLASGASVDVRNKDGSTPLHGAAFLGRIEALELLLDQGADPEAKSAASDTALGATQVPWEITEAIASLLQIQVERAAVEAGRKHCSELLMVARSMGSPTASLFAAIAAGSVKAVEQSLADGARLEDLDPAAGWTPLSMAAFLGHEDIARLLLEKGAQVDARNKDKSSALHGAAFMDRVSLVELLLARGAKGDALDGRGSTPLHSAAFLGRAKTVERLLREKADRRIRNGAGQTPLDVTQIDWETTAFVLRALGLELEQAEVERGRARVAELLRQP